METERLLLRAHTPADLPDCSRLWSDSAVVQHLGGRPFTEEEVWSRMLRYAGLWAWLGFGYWVIEEKATGRFAGEVGFADFRRDIAPPLAGAPEIGWVLLPEMHGKGYATEAVQAAFHWRTAHVGAARTVCLITPANTSSLWVAAKCGYAEYSRTTYKGEPVILLENVPDLQP